MRRILGFCIVLSLLAGAVSEAYAQGKFVLKEKYRITHVCDINGCIPQDEESIMVAKGSYDFGGEFDVHEEAEFTLTIGDFSYTNTMSNAVKYEPGDMKATFHYRPGGSDAPLVAVMNVGWKNGTAQFKAKIKERCFGHDYASTSPGEHPAPLDLYFAVDHTLGSSFSITRTDQPGTAKVKHRSRETGPQSTTKTQVQVKGAFE